MLKLTIITATICRQDLIRCMDTIDSQTYGNWEHIIVVDGEDKYNDDIFKNRLSSKRKLIVLSEGFNNVGNTPRHVASYSATGDYIMYMDEDDCYYTNEAFEQIVKGIHQKSENGILPDWGIFKALRFGGEFFNFPPGHSMTTNNQFFHKPKIKDKWIRYTTRNSYCADGELIEDLKLLSEPVKIETEDPIVFIDVSHQAKRD